MATATIWDLPNYVGNLYTAAKTQTPFLNMIGGRLQALGNEIGGRMVTNFQFPTSQTYAHAAAAQPAITETASLTAPAANNFARSQNINVTQIFHETVDLSYVAMANNGRMSGVYQAGDGNSNADELAFQISRTLEKIARDIEYTFLQGTYGLAANAGQANKTRGIITATTTNATAANGAQLSKAIIDTALRTAWGNGATFSEFVFFVNAYQKQQLSNIYGYAPDDRNIGGVNIKQVETDFGNIGIVLDPFMPTDTLLGCEVSVCSPVYQPVPKKGNFFFEPLSKTGAADAGQIFGQCGLDYGPEFVHFKVTGLATA
jgi:hypothetical protein